MLRVRHPGAAPRDIDLGPCPEVQTSGRGFVQASAIGQMSPLIIGSVHSAMSDGHAGQSRRKAFSINMKDRHNTTAARVWHAKEAESPDGSFKPYELIPRCARWMPNANEYCWRREGHSPRDAKGKSQCRSRFAVENDLGRKRGRRAA